MIATDKRFFPLCTYVDTFFLHVSYGYSEHSASPWISDSVRGRIIHRPFCIRCRSTIYLLTMNRIKIRIDRKCRLTVRVWTNRSNLLSVNTRTTKMIKMTNSQFSVKILYIYNTVFSDARVIFNKIYQ